MKSMRTERPLGSRRAWAWAATTCSLLSTTACDGPHEKAGREADRAAAIASGQQPHGEGPRERLGEAQDKIERADRAAQEARAEALEKRADALRRETEAEATKLDEQARAVRNAN